MASAGRILIMPKGSWEAEAEYTNLDLVFHNGTSWLAKIPSVGIEPSDENYNYWFKMCIGADLSAFLPLSGGNLTGQLGFSNGRGLISANDYGAYLQSKKDSKNYRHIRVESPTQATGESDWVKVVNCVDDVPKHYKLFGEHNMELLLSLLKPSLSDLKFCAGVYTGDYPVANVSKSKAIETQFNNTQLLIVIGQPKSSSGVTSTTIALPGLGVGITHSKDGVLAMSPITTGKQGKNVVLMDNVETSTNKTTNVCDRSETTYSWIAIAMD